MGFFLTGPPSVIYTATTGTDDGLRAYVIARGGLHKKWVEG